MAIYKYEKAKTISIPADEIIVEERVEKYEDVNIWNSFSTSYSYLHSLTRRSSLANLIIPSFFIFFGLVLIYKYFYPEIYNYFNEKNLVASQNNFAPVSDNYIDLAQYISNPAGLTLVTKEAFEKNILQVDTVSKNYKGTFYLSIPSLGMNSLPVTANVDSTTETVYNQVLKNSLAHFQNTGLPVSDVQNNIVIYSHSASPNYNPKPSDPEVAFSFLPNLRVGDDIFIDMDGKKYHYKMSRSKIVEPNEISIITGETNKRSLTLFTCYPPGSSGFRYVAVARPV